MLIGNETAAREHFDEALAYAVQINDRFTEGGIYSYLGLAQTLARNPEGCANAWRALQLLPEQGYVVGTITALEVLAAQAGLRTHHEEAAQLVGAAQALRSATANTATTIYYIDYNRLFDVARGPLDEASFTAGCVVGQKLTLEQVLALAEQVSVGE